MYFNLDYIYNPAPQKAIYLYQAGESHEIWFALGVAFDHDGWEKSKKQYQWKITKILLRRTTDVEYNHFHDMVNTAEISEVARNLYHMLSNSPTTVHMN